MKRCPVGLALLVVLGIGGLGSCAPQQTIKPVSQPVDGRGQRLVEQFTPLLAQSGITVTAVRMGTIAENSQDALSAVVNAFYAQAPGFCPLQETPFSTSETGTAFMLVTAKGEMVQVLLYENGQFGAIHFVTLTGQATKAPQTRRC
jgi:hypothetical protein